MFSQLLIVSSLCILGVLSGEVSPTRRCGGVGTPLQLRISDCEGFCSFVPGRVYNCEYDFIPSSSARALELLIEICVNGLCFEIIKKELPGSSVQPGFVYTAKYAIVPNDILSGQGAEFRATLTNVDIKIIEVCVAAIIEIL